MGDDYAPREALTSDQLLVLLRQAEERCSGEYLRGFRDGEIKGRFHADRNVPFLMSKGAE